jgi:hypothetical protein
MAVSSGMVRRAAGVVLSVAVVLGVFHAIERTKRAVHRTPMPVQRTDGCKATLAIEVKRTVVLVKSGDIRYDTSALLTFTKIC